VHDQGDNDIPSERKLNQLFFQFGQFLSHDTGLSEPNGAVATDGTTGLSGNEIFPIEVDPNDPDFAFPEISLTRSVSIAASASTTGIREQINTITTFIDGSNVYGSDETRARALRSFVGGRMLVQPGPDGNLPPFNTFGLSNANPLHLPEASLFAAGDVRCNEQVGLTGFHTLFLREHNRLADEIVSREFANANLSDPGVDEEIYQRARATVAALLQKITYHEWLPALLGPHAMDDYHGYDPQVDPRITNEFSSAAFRIGHTMLPTTYLVTDRYGNSTPLPLRYAFFNPDYVLQKGIADLIRGQAKYLQQELDRFVVDDVRNFLFGPGFGGLDLASLNIQRGREHGLSSYNDVRESLGLSRARDFSEVTSYESYTTQDLETAYGYTNIDDLDLWTGGLCEQRIPGSSLGETFTAIFVDQFTRLRDGDRFYFENRDVYPESFIQYIFDTTFVDIIRRNTTIDDHELNGYAFFVPEVAPYRPDLRIGNRRNHYTHRGNDRYNESGAGQRTRIRGKSRRWARAHVSLESDGTYLCTAGVHANVTGHGKHHSRIFERSEYGRSNVTAAMKRGSYTHDLAPHDLVTFETQVRPKSRWSWYRSKTELYMHSYCLEDDYATDAVSAHFLFR
jgi:hypothetical protein